MYIMESDDIDITVTTSQLTTLAIKVYRSDNNNDKYIQTPGTAAQAAAPAAQPEAAPAAQAAATTGINIHDPYLISVESLASDPDLSLTPDYFFNQINTINKLKNMHIMITDDDGIEYTTYTTTTTNDNVINIGNNLLCRLDCIKEYINFSSDSLIVKLIISYTLKIPDNYPKQLDTNDSTDIANTYLNIAYGCIDCADYTESQHYFSTNDYPPLHSFNLKRQQPTQDGTIELVCNSVPIINIAKESCTWRPFFLIIFATNNHYYPYPTLQINNVQYYINKDIVVPGMQVVNN